MTFCCILIASKLRVQHTVYHTPVLQYCSVVDSSEYPRCVAGTSGMLSHMWDEESLHGVENLGIHGDSHFLKKPFIWTFKLICGDLIRYIHRKVLLSSTMTTWLFERMSELFLMGPWATLFWTEESFYRSTAVAFYNIPLRTTNYGTCTGTSTLLMCFAFQRFCWLDYTEYAYGPGSPIGEYFSRWGSGIVAHLVMKLCRLHEDMIQRSGTPEVWSEKFCCTVIPPLSKNLGRRRFHAKCRHFGPPTTFRNIFTQSTSKH
jgi:hypothetical protein